MARPSPIEAFIWGENGQAMTPEEIARQRQIAEALLAGAGDTSPVGHWTQGAARVVNAIGGVLKERRADKAASANAKADQSMLASLFSGGSNPAGAFPPAPSANGSPVASGSATASVPSGERAQYIRAGLVKRGLPEHVADGFLMNFEDESGFDPGINEAKPLVPGSRGGYGLYQLTGPRRRAYEQFASQRGAPLDDVDTQLDFMMTELQGPEAAAAKSILGSQDAGTAAAAIAKDFLRPAQSHLNSRVSRYLAGGASPAVAAVNSMAEQQPIQVASLDPAAGIPVQQQAVEAVVPTDTGINQPGPRATIARLLSGDRMGGQPMQIAQAGTEPLREMAGQAQPTQPRAGMNPAIIQALTSPNASPQVRAVAEMMYKQQMEQNDPVRALEMQKLQLEIDAARNPKPKYDFVTGRDGSIFRTDSQGNMSQVYGGKPDLPTNVQEYEYARNQGYQGTYADFQTEQKRAGASQVNIDQKTEGAFDKKLAEKDAEMFSGLSTEGLNARADLGVINELETLLQGQGGALTGVQGWLAGRGVDVGEATSDLQATQALINKLVPTQRQAGSGSMSDRDVELFTRSLPSLWNQPGGNAKIIRVMRGLAEYRMQQGEIANRLGSDPEYTRQQAKKDLMALPNPLADIGKPEKASQPSQGGWTDIGGVKIRKKQ